MRLVIIQAEPVSNIANPMPENEVAMRMTTKARLLNRPERSFALDDVFGSTFNSVVIGPTSGCGPASGICLPPLSGFGKRDRTGARRLEVLAQERACVRERAPARFELRVP